MAEIDVAVIGAGVAGLAAAGELRRKGLRVAVHEARDRIGGRILTHRDPRVAVPIELGAEFVHGEAPITERILREAGLSDSDIAGDHWQAERGRLRTFNGFWKRIDGVLSRIDPDGQDQSFNDFLAQRAGGRPLARNRTAAREFVEGFHAADPAQLSVLSIAPEPGEEPSESAARIGRVVQGYDRLAEWLARDLGEALHLGSPVAEIAWERGRVELTLGSPSAGSSRSFSRIMARAAVVTVPLGVLQASPDEPGGIRFRPEPPRLRETLDLLAMGSVVRLILAFREFPWKGRSDLDRLSFLHTGDRAFRTWWTAYPLRAPVIVAWCGGPRAAELARNQPDEIESMALHALAEHFGISRQRIASRLEGVWSHDWSADPLSRGAYSYARVGGSGAARQLAKPVEKTLFFAGEAA
ncbi:MAG TPA: NAD(P)/FAD-dependent oxidoreductase, partial [Thermoanaerobaculia bacterium]